MSRFRDTTFHFGVAALFTHELDAVPNHEWREIPLLRELPDELGMLVFIAAHVPLFALVIGLVASSNPRTRSLSRLVIALFLLVHGVLHALSTGGPTYEFSSTLSRLLIFGAAACGALFLVQRAKTAPGVAAPGGPALDPPDLVR